MSKEELIEMLKIANCDINTIIFAVNAWEMGAECQKEECALLLEELDEKDKMSNYYKVAAVKVREMK